MAGGRDRCVSRRPATPQEVEAASGRPAASLGARSPLAGSSTTARDPAEVVPGRRGGVRCGSAGTGPVGTLRRPSPGRRTARSSGAPPAPCGPMGSCPAPAVPSRARASPPDPAAARSTGNGTVQRPAKPPYREGRQPGGPGVEREPDGTSGVGVHQGDETRRGRCSRQPTADGTRPRCSEALGPCEPGSWMELLAEAVGTGADSARRGSRGRQTGPGSRASHARRPAGPLPSRVGVTTPEEVRSSCLCMPFRRSVRPAPLVLTGSRWSAGGRRRGSVTLRASQDRSKPGTAGAYWGQ